jgi:hypothetical protein
MFPTRLFDEQHQNGGINSKADESEQCPTTVRCPPVGLSGPGQRQADSGTQRIGLGSDDQISLVKGA